MGVGKMLLSKTFRVVFLFAGVVVPVVLLFGNFLYLVDQNPAVTIDLFGLIIGTMVFSASIIYFGVKLEKSVEKEDD